MEILVSGRLTTFKKLIIYIYISPRDLPNPGFKCKLYVLYVYIYIKYRSLAGYSYGVTKSQTRLSD